jgi:hypothetical protein
MRPEDVEILEMNTATAVWANGGWWVTYRANKAIVREVMVAATDELGAIAALYKRLGVEDE